MKNQIKAMTIDGRPYVKVSERVKFFRRKHKFYSLTTEIVELDDDHCILRGVVKNLFGRVKATGLAREVRGEGDINETSYVENCETSAWGRALGNMGIGIDTDIASYDEVRKTGYKAKGISPHGEGTNEDIISLKLAELNDCKTVGDLEIAKEKMEDTYIYFEKRKEFGCIETIEAMVEEAAVRIGEKDERKF